jgi:ribosome maturation factor RimP
MEKEGIIKDLIKKPLEEININVDSVTFTKEGSVNILRVTIDKEPYVDVDACVDATKIINPIIDKVDIPFDTYILDVCSKEKGGDK